jgi:exodeoxyribonuclease V alpha subunit
LVKGIGPILAKKLVERFGAEVLVVIENRTAELQTVDGIGPKRRERIEAAWRKAKQVREIMLFLHSHGVSTSRAVRIFKAYGKEAIEKVRTNPYTLAKDIYGIGFATADKIAQNLGIPKDSLDRARAGIDHVLLEATSDGHCALPREKLRLAAVKLLEAQESSVEQALAQMLASSSLLLEEIDGEPLVFMPHLRRAEEGIAEKIKWLAGMATVYPPIDFEKAVTWCEGRTGKTLAPSQREAVRTVLANRVVIITGGPGVGKTTLVNSILMILRAKGVQCLLCAPTGRAAKRLAEITKLEAKTIHRLLEIDPGTGRFIRNESSPLACHLLVVDETSMVDVPLMHSLLRALPNHAGLIMVGDVDQLPSVGPGTALQNLIESGVIPVVRLTEVFRQAADSQIIANAHRIRRGQMPDVRDTDPSSDFHCVERDDPEKIAAVRMLSSNDPSSTKVVWPSTVLHLWTPTFQRIPRPKCASASVSTPIALPEKLTVPFSIFNSRAISIHFRSRNPDPVSNNLSTAVSPNLFNLPSQSLQSRCAQSCFCVAMTTLGVMITASSPFSRHRL